MVVLRFISGQGNLKEISCSLGGLISVPAKWAFPVSKAHLFVMDSLNGLRDKSDMLCFSFLDPSEP